MKLKLIPLLIAACCSCTHTVSIDTLPDDFSTEVYTPSHATGFRLLACDSDSTLLALEVYRPDTMRIAIPRGGFTQLLCMSSTYVGALTTIGADDRIVAVSGKQYLTNRRVAERAAEVGYEGAMDYEALLAAKPDLALIYGVGGESALAAKLAELSVPYVYISDFEEQSPIGRAEWMVALGALAGVDGTERFEQIRQAYRPVADSTAAVMINAPYSGSWFIPGRDNYMSQLLRDAGARLTAPQPSGYESRPIDREQALPALERADYWLNPGQAETMEQVRALVPQAKFGGSVWNQTPDFYESGASRPDLVLEELQKIFSASAPDSMRYFKRIR